MDVLEAVGAGVALGAGAGGVVGGAIVGFGTGAADVGAAAGLELWVAAGAAVPGWLAAFDVGDWLELRLDGDGDAEGAVPLADGCGPELVPGPADG